MNIIEKTLDHFVHTWHETGIAGEVFWTTDIENWQNVLCVCNQGPCVYSLPEDLHKILTQDDYRMSVASGYLRWRLIAGEVKPQREYTYLEGICVFLACTPEEYAEIVSKHKQDWGDLIPVNPETKEYYEMWFKTAW